MSEDKIQMDCVVWFNNTYCLKNKNPRCSIFSVPNGGTRNKIEALKLKSTGMKAGVSDLIVLLPNSTTLFIELKAEKGVQSDVQKDFQEVVEKLGFQYFIFRSLEEFQDIIKAVMDEH